MNINSLNEIPFSDGHIESILIGFNKIKISFQAWNLIQYTIIFDNISELVLNDGIYDDMECVHIEEKGNQKKYQFFSNYSDTPLLQIMSADNVRIYECGNGLDIDTGLYDIEEQRYLGNQKNPFTK